MSATAMPLCAAGSRRKALDYLTLDALPLRVRTSYTSLSTNDVDLLNDVFSSGYMVSSNLSGRQTYSLV